MKLNLRKILASLFIMGALTCSAPVIAVDVHKNSVNLSNINIPVRHSTSKKQLAMKFLIAMMGVAASSVIIYVMLTVYNRFIYGTQNTPKVKTQDDEFKTPTNLKDALDIFLKKTK